MTRQEKRKMKLERLANMRRHSDLNASASLPEAHDTRFARRLIYLVSVILMTAFLWSAVTPVNEITTGTGVITTRTLVERVEHPDGGLVAEIHTAKGRQVTKGTPLLTFDTSSLGRELGKLRAAQISLLAEESRIAFLLENRGSVPNFESLEDLSPEELLFWAEQSYLEAQLDLMDAERQSVEATLSSIKAQRMNLAEESILLESRLKRSRHASEIGALARNDLELLEREYLQLKRVLIEVDGEATTQRNALTANALRRNELLAKRQREAALRRAEVEEKLVSAALSIAEIAARIERAQVVATVAGTIMEFSVANPNEIVAPGDLIAKIVPGGSAVEAEIEISAGRIGNVDEGMEARLKILSYDFTRFGEIVGHVSSISPSSFENEAGETVFRVKVKLPNNGENASLVGRPIRPGMTVTADILTDSKKVLTYLLKPLRVLSDRALSEA